MQLVFGAYLVLYLKNEHDTDPLHSEGQYHHSVAVRKR